MQHFTAASQMLLSLLMSFSSFPNEAGTRLFLVSWVYLLLQKLMMEKRDKDTMRIGVILYAKTEWDDLLAHEGYIILFDLLQNKGGLFVLPSINLSHAIQNMLEETFHLSGWSISQPADGQQKECYVAKTASSAVFLKFDDSAPIAVLQRLGELGIAPRLLGAGNLEGRQYVLQDYLTGQHPGWRWFTDHLPLLAQLTQRYHTDIKLKQLLISSTTREYHEQIALELAELEMRMLSLQEDTELAMMLKGIFAELQSQAKQLHAVPLAPVHDDPNGANMFLIDDKVMLVDWDDLLLSDPMRDVSQWLGWHVPQERWPLFFNSYGLPLEQSLITRVYWWSARASFANVLWHIEHDYDYDVFLQDTIAALHQEIRPHQVFRADS